MDIPKTIWLQTGETTLLRCRDTENEVTYIDLVRLAAKAAGRTEEISDEVADFILWEETGFPSFWPDIPFPLETQLLKFFCSGTNRHWALCLPTLLGLKARFHTLS